MNEERDVQTVVNEDSIRNLVAKGVIENVQGEDISTNEMGSPVE